MVETTNSTAAPQAQPFKAETRQLLNILIHSLYTEREIFLRELISNASDALTRMNYEMLINREVMQPEAELAIRVLPDPEKNTLTIVDTGIGMNADELHENLGTIARSGAKAFLESIENAENGQTTDVIGQFGVGFYSAFMVADWIRVVSRNYEKESSAAAWYSTGEDTYTVQPAEKETRGTEVIVHLRDDAHEFTDENRLREVIKKHSDFIAYPIYIGDSAEQVNRQTAIWRQNPRQVDIKDYQEYYKQLTLDFSDPLTYAHLSVDAPVQMYAILYIPSSSERSIFSARKEDGLKLYARKILIQEYSRDLLPEYFRFVQGVVDSEDLPLNVSRESVQSNRLLAQLRKLITSKVIETLKKLGQDKPDIYAQFWKEFSPFIKQGIAMDEENHEALYPLLRYHSTKKPDTLISLDEYVAQMESDQPAIYYILGEDERSLTHSPHLDAIHSHGYDVLLMSDPLDSFVLLHLTKFADKMLKNVASSSLDLPKKPEPEKANESAETVPIEDYPSLRDRFKQRLGDRVADVRFTDILIESPARLIDPEGAINPEMQRVYRLLNREYDVPKKVMELNPKHPILIKLNQSHDLPIDELVIEQLYEDALLIEGLHTDPASMVDRIQRLIQAAMR